MNLLGRTGSSTARGGRRAALIFIYVTIVLDTMGFGFVLAHSIRPAVQVEVPGTPFFLAAALMLASTALAMRVTRGPQSVGLSGAGVAVPDGLASTAGTGADPKDPAE